MLYITHIFFSFTCKHEPGALLNMLSILKELNMTKIESRPIREKAGEFRFFIEIDGNLENPTVKNALNSLKQRAQSFKLLGSY